MLTTTTTITYTDPTHGFTIELPYRPLMDDVYVNDDGTAVTFLVHDESCHFTYDWPDGVTFCEDFSKIDPADWIDSLNDDCDVYAVGRYEHGLVHYSVAGSRHYPDMEFDYGISGYIAITSDYADTAEAANLILSEYSSWCNGEVYGIIEVPVSDPENYDSCFGFIGYDHALECATGGGY